MESVIQILQLLTGFAGPIIVAWFTARMNKITKDNAEIKRLEDEKTARDKKELDDRINMLVEQVEKLQQLTSTSQEALQKLEGVDEKFDERFDTIADQQKLIGQYTHKLAQLVITVATGMRDQHLDGNITRAVDQYREFEQETLSSIMSKNV